MGKVFEVNTSSFERLLRLSIDVRREKVTLSLKAQAASDTVAGQKYDHLVARLHSRRKIVHGDQYVLLRCPCPTVAVVGEKADMVFRKACRLHQQVLYCASIIARISQALNLPRISAYSDEQSPLVVGERRLSGCLDRGGFRMSRWQRFVLTIRRREHRLRN